MRLTTQSGIVPRLPCSGQILIVQAGGAFTLEELSLAAPVFLAIMTWLGWVTTTENQTSFINVMLVYVVTHFHSYICQHICLSERIFSYLRI